MLKDKVSIIIPIYNAEKFLRNCLDSVINQSYENLEIILVNDGSTDSSLNICNEYQKKDNRIILIDQQNKGVSESRNNGVKKSTGKYVLFIDSDDCIVNNCVEEMLKVFEITKCDLVCCDYEKVPSDMVNSYNLIGVNGNQSIISYSKNDGFYKLINDNKFGGYIWNKMYLRKYLVGEVFNSKIFVCEDFLMNCEYFSLCNKICYIPKKLYIYNVNDLSVTGNKYVFNDRKKTIIDAYQKIIKIYNKESKENIDFVLYNYLKVLLYVKFVSKLNNMQFDFDKEIKNTWKLIKISKKINSIQKVSVFFRMKFPFISMKIKKILSNRK